MNDADRTTRTDDVWRRFSTRLRAFLRARLSDEAAADDVLQDVFIKVHAKIHTLRDDERLQSWLYQIARNAVADHFRSPERSIAMDDITAAVDVAEDVASSEAEQTLAASLLEMVGDLPEHYRDAIVLTEFEGLSQAEMAQRLHISLSGGKSRVQRGREKLKDLLLDCCHVEVDRLGNVIGYRERKCCDTCGPHDACSKSAHRRPASK